MSIHDAGLQKLLREPARLRGEAERINVEMETLVSENYRVFVENLTCSVHLQKEDKKLQDIFIGLAEHVEQLNGTCGEFKDLVHEFVQAHKRIRRTLQCHLQLLELLELPQLVESCTRNGALDEALELATFVRSLERRHIHTNNMHNNANNNNTAGKNSVIQSIAADVSASLLHMRRQLLQQLSSSISISKQVYIIATLRKVDGILMTSDASVSSAETAEARRMMDYLEVRSIFVVQNALNNAIINSNSNNIITNVDSAGQRESSRHSSDSLGPYGKAVELLENRRTSLYTVINQFRSLFSGIEPEIAEEILRKWISHHVLLILRELSSYLSEIQDGVAIKALLEQAVYFAKRLADEGGDFTAAVLRLFTQCVCDVVVRHCVSATQCLRDTLNESETVLAYESGGFSLYTPVTQFASLTQVDTTSETHLSSSSLASIASDILPPVTLLSFPPLCHHLNTILNALNFLRACPLLSVYEDIRGMFEKLGWDCVACVIDKSTFLRSVSSKYTVSLPNEFGKHNKQIQNSRDNTNTITTSNNSSTQRLDEMYAEAVAFHLLPHVFMSLSLIFRKIDCDATQRVYNTYKLRVKNNEPARLLSTVAESEDVFGTGTTTDLLHSYWKHLADYKLISHSFDKQSP